MQRGTVPCFILFGLLAVSTNASAQSVDDFCLKDYLGQEHRLADYQESKLVVLAFLGTECPLAKLYASRLQSLADEFSEDLSILGVNPNVQDSPTEIAAYARRHGVHFPILKDLGNQLADRLEVVRTPEVILLDRERKICYRGRVDDQFVIGITRDAPSRDDLRIAIDELLAERTVTVAKTEPIGCLIGRVREANEDSEVTYSNQIARIFQQRCVSCHRAGEIGPFELTSFADVEGWGDMINEVVQQQRMPPWHANPDYGSFLNDGSLTSEEKRLISVWVENGCPEGDPSQAPPPINYTSGWQLPRAPDQIIAMSDEPFSVPANAGPSGVPYQYFQVKSEFTEDKWVRDAEVQPGNPTVVHHIIVYAVPPGKSDRHDWIFLSAYVPGLRYDPLPPKSAKLVPARSTLLFELHYTPVGSPQEDISRLGLIFADPDDITHEVVTVSVDNDDFIIPPQASNHVVTATSKPIQRDDLQLLSLSPHMHLRGKAFRYELISPNGEREILLDVPAYDFNWQTRYLLAHPRPLPRGSRLHCRAAFDNSKNNLANPDPAASVQFGEQSWDEMMIGFCDVVLPRQEHKQPGRKLVNSGFDVVGEFDRADLNGDHQITQNEASDHPLLKTKFGEFDSDSNGVVDLHETLQFVANQHGKGGG